MRVSLITTGRMEFLALPEAFARLFPSHTFYAEAMHPGSAGPFNGFTSARVRPLTSDDAPGLAAELVRAALGTLVPAGPADRPADLSIILDDVELCNKGNEGAVIAHMRAAALQVIAATPAPQRPGAADLLRRRASFHLAAPMAEGWFFGDPAGIAAEQQGGPPVMLSQGRDPEDFCTDDPAYEGDDGAQCAAWAAGQARRPRWLIPQREAHPKAYMTWLMRAPQLADCTRYKEGKEGRRILSQLRWGTVLSSPTWFSYLRALVRDLEDGLGIAAVGVPPGGAEAPLTRLHDASHEPVLRNI